MSTSFGGYFIAARFCLMAAPPSAFPVIRGDALDFYLAQGYYRMQQDLFTCQFVPFDGRVYTAHWLRLALNRVGWGPEQRRLLRRNARLVATVQPFRPTPEYEDLYTRYRNNITFDAAPTVAAVLLGDSLHNVFNTYAIELRDGARLVAVGIFDLGRRTLAGILNFYDPDYRRDSLGKYLLLLKINYAFEAGLQYYYPGYMVHGYPKFDYKLAVSPSATEVFDSIRGQWRHFSADEVAAQSAELLGEWLPEELRGQFE